VNCDKFQLDRFLTFVVIQRHVTIGCFTFGKRILPFTRSWPEVACQNLL